MKQLKFSFLIISLIMILSNIGWGQWIINSTTQQTQNFDGMGTSVTAYLPSGFRVNSTATYSSGTTATTLAYGTTGTGVVTGSSTGGTINWANGVTASATDRALGILNTGSYTSPRTIMVQIQNTTGSTISSIDIIFDYEKYRSGSRAFNWTFFHGSDGLAWTANTSGDQSYAADENNAVVFNPPTTTATKTFTISGLNIENNGFYYFAWTYTGVGGSSNGQGTAIDNLKLTLNSGVVSPPTTQASNITFSSVQSSQMTVNWTSGNGAKRIVKMNTSNSFTNPGDGTDPTANTVYSGSGEQVVYNNNSNTVTVTGLNANTTYWYRVYEYNGSGTGTKYLTSEATNNPNSQITPFAAPSTQTSAITFQDVQLNQMTINWTPGNGTNRAIFMKETSGTITNPSNGSVYTASSDWSSKGTQLGTSGYYCIYNGTGSSVTVTNLTSGTLYVVQAFEYNGSGTGTVYNVETATNNPNSQATTSKSPTLIANPTSLTGFSTDAGTPSSNQTYSISGSNLTPSDGQINIVAPTNFEVSSDGTNYNPSINVAYTGGGLNSTTIYVRVASNSTTGSISGNISNSGGGASAVNVALSGFVYASKPTIQPTNITFANVTTNSFDLSWTNGDGSNTIVLIKSGSAVNSNPVTGTSYTANATFGSGDQIGTGNYVIYNSTGTSVSITGLSANTTYYVALYSFNGSETIVNYLTTNPLTGNQATSAPAVPTYTWTGAAGDGLWSTATNWSPTRTTPATNDVLQFNDASTKTITGVPTQTIGQFLVTNNTTVNLQSAAEVTLTISGSTGTGLSVTAGSQLNFNETKALTMTVGTGATGSISGSMTFSRAGHRLIGTDASSITFNSGSMFTAGTSFSGNAFGTTKLNSIVFANGSTYIQQAGSNPFGAGQPNSVVVFQTGSNYKVDGDFLPSFSGRTYANFEINNSAFSQTISSGAAKLTVDNFAITQGSLTITTKLPIDIKGNVVINGTFIYNPSSTGATITLNGTSAQTITNNGTLTFGSFSTINLNNSNGLTLGSNITMNTLTLTAGKILLGSNNLTLDTITGSNASNYIVTDGTGGLIRRNIGNSETLFPIGTADAYSPAWITNSGTPGDYTINVVSDPTGTNNGADRVKLKWDVNGPASSNIKLRIGWLTSQEGTNFTLNRSTYANLWHLYSGNWVTAGPATLASGLGGEFVDFTLYATGITVFSPFGTGLNESSMPVTLASLTSNVSGRNIVLNWSTSSEINNAGFDVERKSATGDWQKTGYVKGNGTTNENKTYSYKDMNLQTGKYYYRLKQIDYNGNFEYHNLTDMIEVGVPDKFALSQNYPNPFNPVTKINFDLPKDSKVDMRIYDMLGREVALLLNEVKTAGYYTINFNASRLSSGIYFYRLSTGDFTSVKKLVVIK